MLRDHLARNSECLPLKIGVLHLLQAQTARVILLPYEDAQFVAQIEEYFVVGVVRRAHRIGAQVADEGKVVRHGSKGQRAAVLRVIFVTADALDPEGRAVEQDVLARKGDFAEAEAVDKVVKGYAAALQRRRHGVKSGRFRRPCRDIVKR